MATPFTTTVCKMENAQVPLHSSDANPGQFARIQIDVDELKRNDQEKTALLKEMSQDIDRLKGGQKPCQQHPMTPAELIEGTEKVSHPLLYSCGSSLKLTTHKLNTQITIAWEKNSKHRSFGKHFEMSPNDFGALLEVPTAGLPEKLDFISWALFHGDMLKPGHSDSFNSYFYNDDGQEKSLKESITFFVFSLHRHFFLRSRSRDHS